MWNIENVILKQLDCKKICSVWRMEKHIWRKAFVVITFLLHFDDISRMFCDLLHGVSGQWTSVAFWTNLVLKISYASILPFDHFSNELIGSTTCNDMLLTQAIFYISYIHSLGISINYFHTDLSMYNLATQMPLCLFLIGGHFSLGKSYASTRMESDRSNRIKYVGLCYMCKQKVWYCLQHTKCAISNKMRIEYVCGQWKRDYKYPFHNATLISKSSTI